MCVRACVCEREEGGRERGIMTEMQLEFLFLLLYGFGKVQKVTKFVR